MLENYNDVINVNDLCKILGISRKTAYKLLKEEIPHRRIGSLYRISKQAVLQYIEGNNGIISDTDIRPSMKGGAA